jgi:hypothetical protein
MMPPDGVVPITSVTATSIMGWGGFVFGFIACAILVWKEVIGKGRSLATIDGKIEHLCKQVDDMEGRLGVVDGLADSVRELTQEWRGVTGDNGYRSIIRENSRRIGAIERRNDKIDAVREEELRRGGGQQRRHMDRELNNLMPEEREEQG